MKKQSSRLYVRSMAALGVSAALMMALTGCLGGNNDAAPQPIPKTDQATTAPATTEGTDGTDGERGSSELENTETTAAPAPAGDGKLTAPGTTLKLGDIAQIHSSSGEKGTEKYKVATFDTTVTKIVAGDPADLSQFKDAAKYAGQTPYYVFYQSTLTSLSTPSAGMSDASLNAHLKDGSKAQKLIVFGTLADCKTGSFETEGKDDAFSYKIGSTKGSCSVFLAPGGDEITSVSHADSNFRYETYSDNPYLDAPITWTK